MKSQKEASRAGHLYPQHRMQGPRLLPGLCILLSLSGAAAQLVSGCWCPKNAYCYDATNCACIPGYASESGQKLFTFPLEICKDIDECKPPISVDCGLNAECQNTEGSFHCRCVAGYELISGDAQFKNSSENTCQKMNSSKPTKELQEIVNNFKLLLTNETVWRTGDKREIASTASSFLQNVELKVLETALKTLGQKFQRAENSAVAVKTQVVADNCSEEGNTFRLNTDMNSMDIHCKDVIQGNTQGPSAVALIAYSSLGNILNATFFEKRDEKDPMHLNSQVISGAIGPKRNTSLSRPVTLTFQHLQMNPRSKKTVCVYWKVTAEGGYWSRDGCFLMQVNQTHTVCRSTHLSSFAVLMAFTSQEEDPALTILTYVGLSLSLLCLLLAALTFLLCKAIRNISTSIHLQLSLCLFLAHLLFLTAIDRTENKVLCAFIAGALHYLYLAAFSWMLLEGLQLFLTARNLTVVNYSSMNKFMKCFMFPVGYGLAAVIVAISAACRPHLYGSPDRCWLQLDQGFTWGFLGPVCAIVCVNSVFFALVLCILRRKLSSLNNEVSTIQNTRMLTFKATAQLFILGCTWCLGLLQVGPAAQVMAYLFTIINCLQGFFIFLVYCLLSQQVRKQYQKWFTDIMKSKSESEQYTLSSRSGPDSRPTENK